MNREPDANFTLVIYTGNTCLSSERMSIIRKVKAIGQIGYLYE